MQTTTTTTDLMPSAVFIALRMTSPLVLLRAVYGVKDDFAMESSCRKARKSNITIADGGGSEGLDVDRAQGMADRSHPLGSSLLWNLTRPHHLCGATAAWCHTLSVWVVLMPIRRTATQHETEQYYPLATSRRVASCGRKFPKNVYLAARAALGCSSILPS